MYTASINQSIYLKSTLSDINRCRFFKSRFLTNQGVVSVDQLGANPSVISFRHILFSSCAIMDCLVLNFDEDDQSLETRIHI